MVSAWETADHCFAPMGACQFVQGGGYAALHFQKGFAFGEAEVAGSALNRPPCGKLVEGFETPPRPKSEIAFVETFVDADFALRGYADRGRSLLRSFHRRGVDGGYLVLAGDVCGSGFGWATPLSDSPSPAALPGSTLPVVGVSAWRISRMVVGFGTDADCFGAVADCFSPAADLGAFWGLESGIGFAEKE